MHQQSNRPFHIREMELEDLPAVYALGEAVFTADKWPSMYRTWDEYEPVTLFSTDGDFCFIAERDARLVGFALGSLIEKRHSAWSYGYLTWLAVDPELKRQKIATLLVEAVTDAYIRAGARMLIVDTAAQNTNAIGFFRRHGFRDEDRHVYLSKNLTDHPGYRRRRRRKD
jgi:ribosomal protein S18 acetylase RimI-like enzyme